MRLLAIDPGETVGWAMFEGDRKFAGGQSDWLRFRDELAYSLAVGSVHPAAPHPVNLRPSGQAPRLFEVDQIVMEDFVVYPEDVGPGPPPPWDELITARLIGAVQLVADLAGVPVAYQGAKIKSDALAAAASTDFARPLHENRHENDATMHGTYYRSRLRAAALDATDTL